LKKRKEKKPKIRKPICFAFFNSVMPLKTENCARNCKKIKEGKKGVRKFYKRWKLNFEMLAAI
jgi:hypothetical protein